jgi:hypothetical protein
MGLPSKDQLGAPIRRASASAAEQARARVTASRVTVSSVRPALAPPAGSRRVGQPPAHAFAPYARTSLPVSSALSPSESPTLLPMPDCGSVAVQASVADSTAPPVAERSEPSSPVDRHGSWSDASAAHHEDDLPWTHGRGNSAFDLRLSSSASAAAGQTGQTVLAPALLRRCVSCTACAAIPRHQTGNRTARVLQAAHRGARHCPR